MTTRSNRRDDVGENGSRRSGGRRRRSRSDSRSGHESDSDYGERSPSHRGDRNGGSIWDKGLTFQELEAVRHVEIITRNEYPLPHLPRDKVRERSHGNDDDDEQADCYCEYPDPEEIERCGKDTPPKRCDDVSCLNFATYVECNEHCPAGQFCQNQRLQHSHLFPKLEAFKTEKKGFGVRTTEDIPQSKVVGEYVGEIIDQKELTRRLKSVPRHELNFYYLLLQPGIYIDARNKGSFTRFVNHSCEPNCKTEKWTVKGETRIAVIALRDIAKGEELTFDYQWKALGSRQITCYCESPNCKGIIGTEGDTVKDLFMKGYFREPKPEEIGDAIVNRRIRIFDSLEDHSLFSNAIVRRYDKERNKHEVDYEENLLVTEDVFDSPSEESKPKKERFICLDEVDWHIYLDGVSEDQVDPVVFSIPKRRVVEPKQIDGSTPAISASATTSPFSNKDMSTNIAQPNEVPIAAKSNFLNGDTHQMMSSKLLVKGIPLKCDEAGLRRLFTLDERRRWGHDQSKKEGDLVVSLDMFFFDDASGWALVELSDAKYIPIFHSKYHARPFMGTSLRLYHAGNKEIENFYRAKRNSTLHRRDADYKSKIDTSLGNGVKNGDVGEAMEASKSIPSYCFGRKLHWLVSVEQMEDSPSRRMGISASLEESLRTKYAKSILRIVKKLHLDREDATSAIIALNRYFTFHAMNVRNVELLAAATLNLFLKANSRKVPWKVFVSEVYAAKYSSNWASDASTKLLSSRSPEFQMVHKQLVSGEREILEGLRYDLRCEDPYALLDILTSGKNQKRLISDGTMLLPLPAAIPPSDVQKEAKHLLAEALGLSVWVHSSIECIVLSIVYLSAAVYQATKDVSTEARESDHPIAASVPDFLPPLDGKNNELDALLLLECSLAISESLKDRWVRLEKTLRQASKRAERNGEWFDTEQFAVSRQKPMEMSERIAQQLKQWIQGPSTDGSPHRDDEKRKPSNRNYITLAALCGSVKRSSIAAKGSADSSTHEPLSISAASVVPKEVTRSAGGGSNSNIQSANRLHANEIVNVEAIRKRGYLGTISDDFAFDIAGKHVYLQPWPYREHQPVYSEEHGIVDSCVRELANILTLHTRSPDRFVMLVGIVFPEEKKVNPAINDSKTSKNDIDVDMMDFSVPSTAVGGLYVSPPSSRLTADDHYLAFEQPMHMYSGIFEAKVIVPPLLRKKAIYDLLQSLVICHNLNYIHRFVSASHLFVFKDGVKLCGYYSMRKTTSKTKEPGGNSTIGYEMSESERKEHRYGSWLNVSAPEILLGENMYTWRSDIWSAGCVMLAILLDNTPFLQAQDVKVQLDLIFRLCGTPRSSWPDGMNLPQFQHFKPKNEYKMRLRKTLLEQKEKFPDFPEDAIDVLESMLQLDPTKRLSAKKLLEMSFFDEIREVEQRSPSSVNFGDLPSTFETQKKKLWQHLKSKKRRLSNYGESHRSSFKEQHSRNSSRSSSNYQRKSSSEDKRGTGDDDRRVNRPSSASSTHHHRKSRDSNIEMGEDVPLPASFHISTSIDATSDRSSSFNVSSQPREKRAKLGWGMGLHSSQSAAAE